MSRDFSHKIRQTGGLLGSNSWEKITFFGSGEGIIYRVKFIQMITTEPKCTSTEN